MCRDTKMKCELCKPIKTCREPATPLIQGRLETRDGKETIIFQKIKDCPVKK